MGGEIHTANTPSLLNTPRMVSTFPHMHRYRPTPKWSFKRSRRSVLKSLIPGKPRKSSNSILSLRLLHPSWTLPLISPASRHTCSNQCYPTPPATSWSLISSTTRWTLIGHTNSITKWTPTNRISNTRKWTPTLSISSTRRWTLIRISSTTKLILIRSINNTIKWTRIPNSSIRLANSKL